MKEAKYAKYELGTFIAPLKNKNALYIIVECGQKYGNIIYICLPIVEKTKKSPINRYIYKLFENKIAVINRPKRFLSTQIVYKQARMAKDIVDQLVCKYKKFKLSPDSDTMHKKIITSDGYRNGNPWEGLGLMNSRPKIYRG